MRTDLSIAVSLAAALLAHGAAAHHAYSVFDVNKEVTLRGIVKQFQWSSPHIWVELMVPGPSGRQTECAVVGASPSILERFGWRRDTMKPGDRIEIVIHPRTDGALGGSLVTAVVNGQAVGAVLKPT